MCGRFMISKKVDEITERFNVEVEIDKYKPVYNAAPTRQLPVITNQLPEKLGFFSWGLVPFWAKDPKTGNKMINARAETLLEKPAFRNLLKNKRCLVVSDGFYEWKKTEQGKIPHCIRRKDNALFAFAGLWDQWKDAEGKILQTFTIITCAPNSLMAPIHNHMPVILSPEEENAWLDTALKTEELLPLLNPFESEIMQAYEVSDMVNSPRNDLKEISEPLTKK